MSARTTGEGSPVDGAHGPWLDTTQALMAFCAELKEHAGWCAWEDCGYLNWSHPEDGRIIASPDADGDLGEVQVQYLNLDDEPIGFDDFALPATPQYPTIAERAAAYQRLIIPHLDMASALARDERSREWCIDEVGCPSTGSVHGLYLRLDRTGVKDRTAIFISADLADEFAVRKAIARHGIAAFAAIAHYARGCRRLSDLLGCRTGDRGRRRIVRRTVVPAPDGDN